LPRQRIKTRSLASLSPADSRKTLHFGPAEVPLFSSESPSAYMRVITCRITLKLTSSTTESLGSVDARHSSRERFGHNSDDFGRFRRGGKRLLNLRPRYLTRNCDFYYSTHRGRLTARAFHESICGSSDTLSRVCSRCTAAVVTANVFAVYFPHKLEWQRSVPIFRFVSIQRLASARRIILKPAAAICCGPATGCAVNA